ncbi:MAG: sugar phosphate nucleotidyltransferase [Bacteroidota bacterium]
MPKVTKAIIPAAGKGKRMRPLTNYLPKAMIPLGKKPVIEHIVAELKSAAISDIAVIVNLDDEMILDYFKEDDQVTCIVDDSFSGPGGAILKAESFIKKEDFVVAFSDAPLKGPRISRVVEDLIFLKEKQNAFATLAMYSIDQTEISKRGVIQWQKGTKIEKGPSVVLEDIIEKPGQLMENPWASACRYVLEYGIFEVLKRIGKDDNGEVQLTPAIRYGIRNGKEVLGYPLPKEVIRYDTGNFEDYFKAQRAFMNAT